MSDDRGDTAGREARRQQVLLAAVLGRDEPAGLAGWLQPEGLAEGLAAYRRHGWAAAARALSVSHPVTEALIGPEDFARLARTLWTIRPPRRGDWADWGEALPALIADSPSLAAHPYLADVARLDAACHAAERAADRPFDAASLQGLADPDPAHLRLVLAPGAALIDSRYPIVSLWQAHQDGAHPGLWAQARERLAAGCGETAWVWRPGWRACCVEAPADERPWLAALLRGAPLSEALAEAGPSFELEAWLARALAEGSLRALCPIPPEEMPR